MFSEWLVSFFVLNKDTQSCFSPVCFNVILSTHLCWNCCQVLAVYMWQQIKISKQSPFLKNVHSDSWIFFFFYKLWMKMWTFPKNSQILAQKLQVAGWPMSPFRKNVAKWNQEWLHQERNKVQERASQSPSGIVWRSTTTDVFEQEKPPQSDRFGALLQRRVGRYHQVKMCHADRLLPKEA